MGTLIKWDSPLLVCRPHPDENGCRKEGIIHYFLWKIYWQTYESFPVQKEHVQKFWKLRGVISNKLLKRESMGWDQSAKDWWCPSMYQRVSCNCCTNFFPCESPPMVHSYPFFSKQETTSLYNWSFFVLTCILGGSTFPISARWYQNSECISEGFGRLWHIWHCQLQLYQVLYMGARHIKFTSFTTSFSSTTLIDSFEWPTKTLSSIEREKCSST